MAVFPEAVENAGIDGKAMLAMIPFLFIIMNIVLPLNFLVTLAMVGVFLGSFAPILLEIDDAPKDMWLFTLFLPFMVLTYDKYRKERVAREDFAKTVSLDEAQGLMQQTLRRYFGDVLSDKMLNERGEIEGENRWVSISFTDIASYSTITENMSPEVALGCERVLYGDARGHQAAQRSHPELHRRCRDGGLRSPSEN